MTFQVIHATHYQLECLRFFYFPTTALKWQLHGRVPTRDHTTARDAFMDASIDATQPCGATPSSCRCTQLLGNGCDSSTRTSMATAPHSAASVAVATASAPTDGCAPTDGSAATVASAPTDGSAPTIFGVRPNGGLCNRLFNIASVLHRLPACDSTLRVCWVASDSCPATFDGA